MKETPKWLTTYHKIRNLILNICIATLPLAAFLALIRLIIGG
nr:MAG TPA: hypothetical protein [Caudoviricetes sp.]